MKKIIIFDLDNTFYNYQESHDLALKSVFDHQTLFTDYELFSNEYLKARKKVKTILKNSTSKNNRSIYFKFMLLFLKVLLCSIDLQPDLDYLN